MKPKTISELKLTGESAHSFVNHGGQHVELGRAEQVGVEDSLHVSTSEGPPSEGHRGGGGGAELEVEGVQEGVDDGGFEWQSSRDDGHDQGEEWGEEGSNQLGQDDGGEHDHKDGNEVGELAQVQSVVLSGHIAALVVSVVVGGAGLPIAGARGGVGVILLAGGSCVLLAKDQRDQAGEDEFSSEHLQTVNTSQTLHCNLSTFLRFPN